MASLPDAVIIFKLYDISCKDLDSYGANILVINAPIAGKTPFSPPIVSINLSK
jgi:hypothetical protein